VDCTGVGLARRWRWEFSFQGTLKVPLHRFFAVTSADTDPGGDSTGGYGCTELSEARWLPSSKAEMRCWADRANELFFLFLSLALRR